MRLATLKTLRKWLMNLLVIVHELEMAASLCMDGVFLDEGVRLRVVLVHLLDGILLERHGVKVLQLLDGMVVAVTFLLLVELSLIKRSLGRVPYVKRFVVIKVKGSASLQLLFWVDFREGVATVEELVCLKFYLITLTIIGCFFNLFSTPLVGSFWSCSFNGRQSLPLRPLLSLHLFFLLPWREFLAIPVSLDLCIVFEFNDTPLLRARPDLADGLRDLHNKFTLRCLALRLLACVCLEPLAQFHLGICSKCRLKAQSFGYAVNALVRMYQCLVSYFGDLLFLILYLGGQIRLLCGLVGLVLLIFD